MLGIKKNDTVKILSGKDKGKTGRVIQVIPERNRLVVQGLNLVKKHTKKRRQDEPGGIISKESSLHQSKVNIVCGRCNKATRIGIELLKDGTKARYCKKCKELL
ncbi:Ribosomal protein L24 [Candidatus Omnitrophus magneticus]|uniref:Large ribosomal subunit protein uL24 n=1 Tax=Candidatus Omnitrophus magneticus TaxID=1609969 RepID=A0A0F0CSB4_9BACT|nr:Ribosomal protein L24 [Candidatus Omnitrophus magneticus]